jgi:hypothetical protein
LRADFVGVAGWLVGVWQATGNRKQETGKKYAKREDARWRFKMTGKKVDARYDNQAPSLYPRVYNAVQRKNFIRVLRIDRARLTAD